MKKWVPNFLTFLRVFFTPLFIYFVLKGSYFIWLAIIIFTVAALTDLFDGYVARRYHLSTSLGVFLDPLFGQTYLVISSSIHKL